MLSHSESKYIQSLCHKKQRDLDKVFIAEGVKIVEELLLSDLNIRKIYATELWVKNNKTTIETVIVSEAELQKISLLQNAHQVLAVVEYLEITTLTSFKNKITLALDGIQDPGNFGTIIRIADWFGVTQIICSMDCVELYNSKVIQSTMGSFVRVNINYNELKNVLHNVNVPIYGALLNGKYLSEFEKPTEGILVIGNESKGIRENILPFINKSISIKKVGGAESLNAAVATGIILSHIL